MKRKLILSLLAATLGLTFAFGLSACNNGSSSDDEEKNISYTICIENASGFPIEEVIIRAGNTETITDEEGTATLSLPEHQQYTLELELPAGYENNPDTYTLDGNGSPVNITLTSNVISAEIESGIILSKGDIIYDINYQNDEGTQKRLSQSLKTEKNMAVLIFVFDYD